MTALNPAIVQLIKVEGVDATRLYLEGAQIWPVTATGISLGLADGDEWSGDRALPFTAEVKDLNANPDLMIILSVQGDTSLPFTFNLLNNGVSFYSDTWDGADWVEGLGVTDSVNPDAGAPYHDFGAGIVAYPADVITVEVTGSAELSVTYIGAV